MDITKDKYTEIIEGVAESVNEIKGGELII